MPTDESRLRVESQQTAEIINIGHRELVEMAPSMLKKKVVELVFLPWLSRFTGRVVSAAKEEERQAILAALPQPPEAPEADPAWCQGFNTAVEHMRAKILDRGAVPTF